MKIIFNPSRVPVTNRLGELAPGTVFWNSNAGVRVRANLPIQIQPPGNPSDIGCFSLVDGCLGWYAPDTQVELLDADLQVYSDELKE